MYVIDAFVTFADAITEEGVDYGTGYYATRTYSNGRYDMFGPFNYEEDASEYTRTIY